jgi:predicted ATPase
MPRIRTEEFPTEGRAAQIVTPDRRLRVFVSSTLDELAREREAVRRAVEQLRLTPIMFELGARPHPPRALYRSYLAQSEVFVGVYWQRYGWVAPDMEISGLEDELVLSAEMPRLIYVKRPAPEIEPRLAAMLERLEGAGDASYKLFSEASELQELVVDDLAVLLSERFAARSVAEARPASNVPVATSTFFGRDEALQRLGLLLADENARLLTLTGPGGAGKTRLALEAARAQTARFDDGVFFIDLSAERVPDGVFDSVARALAIGREAEGSVLESLQRALRDRRVLLVLDNFEQVVSAAAGLVDLLTNCPRLKIVVTSREALRVRAEQVFAVPPLAVPTGDSVADVVGSAAGQLFCERAAATGSGFALTDGNAADVAAICRALDGLPLAIELAAARTKVFAVDELRTELETRHEILVGGMRDLPERQRTLRSTVEWSHDLLTAAERAMFALFSVFTEARLADVEAAVRRVPSVAALDVVDSFGSLVDKSLVQPVAGGDGRPRFSMLQTIRAFAREQLDAAPEVAAEMNDAHAAHYTDLALGLHARLTRSERADVLAALGADLANVRAAWDRWVGVAALDRLADLLEPLWGYYDARGDYRSAIVLGEDFLRALSALPDSTDRRSAEFAVQTNLARTHLAVRGFTHDAERAILDAVARFEAAGDVRERFSALRSLASLQLMRSESEKTAAVAGDLLEIAEAEADPELLTDAHLLACLRSGWTENLSVAIAHADEAVAQFDRTTSGFVAFRVGPNPGVVANAVSGLFRWMAGFPDSAVVRIDAALRLARELDHPPSVAYALHHANVVDLWRSDLASLDSRAEELLLLAETHGYPIWRALALVFGGMAASRSGDVDAGLEGIEAGFALYHELATPPIFWPVVLMMRATAFGAAGRIERALEIMGESEASVKGDDPLAADIAISHGDLLLRLPAPERAEERFEYAAGRSASRGARMVELQALTRLATLRRGTPAAPATLLRLRELHDWFTEGLDTAPLVAARAALTQAE